MILYLDMDGVLTNFDQYVIDRVGKTLHDFANSQEGWDAISHFSQDIYFHLDKFPEADLLVETCLRLSEKYNFTIAILTAIPKFNRVPKAKEHKVNWLEKYYPKLLDNFNIGPHAADKQNHCQPGDILIDDNKLNIEQWNGRQGKGILHVSAEKSIKELKEILVNK